MKRLRNLPNIIWGILNLLKINDLSHLSLERLLQTESTDDNGIRGQVRASHYLHWLTQSPTFRETAREHFVLRIARQRWCFILIHCIFFNDFLYFFAFDNDFLNITHLLLCPPHIKVYCGKSWTLHHLDTLNGS